MNSLQARRTRVPLPPSTDDLLTTTRPAPVSFDRLMTLAEVGACLGKTAQGVRMMVYRDEIAAVRIGKRGLRIRVSVLHQYLGALPHA